MPGRDLSEELFGATAPVQQQGGRDLSEELFGPKVQKPAKPEATTLSRVQAGAAGINKGFFSDLLGIPVDTAANVIDLGKAAVGTVATALGRPDYAPNITDRRTLPGTSDWIAQKFNDVGLGSAINNPNPEDAVSRVLHSGGRVAGASVVPNSRAAISGVQQAGNMAKGALGGLAAGTVGEVAPEWAGVAGMIPQLAITGGAAAIKRGIRGDEAGRLAMEQRIQDLKNGGVESPSVGLASGNRGVMGVENLLAQTPGSVSMYEAARAKNVAGMKAKTEQVRDSASNTYGAAESGTAIQGDIKNLFKDRIFKSYEALNDRFSGTIPQDQRFNINGTLSALDATTSVNPMAPRTSAGFVQPRIAALRDNILADTTVTTPNIAPSSFTTRNVGLPLDTIRGVRSDIGKEAASKAIFGTPEQADFKRIYGGLSEDMRGAARLTDRAAGPQPNNIGPSETALNRANNYYSNGMKRADEMSAIATKTTPEAAYNTVVNSLNSGGTMYSKLRNIVSPETRGKIVATAIDDMGKASAGQQNAAGDGWSPRTFLTNYNKIDGGGRTELFKRLPGGAKMADNLADIAKTADMLSDSSKIWANPSGTAPALVARGTIGTIGAGAVGGMFYTPLLAPAATAAGGLVAANQLSKRLLLNPKFVGWLAKAPNIPPAQAQSHIQRLIANAKLTNDKQYIQDVNEYLQSVENGGEEQQ